MSRVMPPFPDDVQRFVESTPWTVATRYAATWPHEYTVRTPENAQLFVALAQHIFDHGVEGHFYADVRKYHHERGKVDWLMDPTPETTDLVNRCNEDETYEARVTSGKLPTR